MSSRLFCVWPPLLHLTGAASDMGMSDSNRLKHMVLVGSSPTSPGPLEKISRTDDPPPYPGHTPGAQYPQMGGVPVAASTVVVTQPVVGPVVIGLQMGFKPAPFVCKSCSAQITTRVEQKPTLKTHLFALLFCAIGFWPCVCIPYCMDSCQSADHYCPNCNAYIGSYIN